MAPDSYADWRDRLATANNPAFWPIEAIDAELEASRAQFWACETAALVTRVVHYPGTARACEALAGAGDMAGLVEAIAPQVEQWASENGCTHLLIAGREGWRRVQSDWLHHQTTVLREL